MKIHTNLKKKHLKNRFLLNKPVLTAFLSQIFDFYANPGERERENKLTQTLPKTQTILSKQSQDQAEEGSA